MRRPDTAVPPPVALSVALLIVALAVPALAEDSWPAGAMKRFDEATVLSRQPGQHAKAAALYREVADWPEGGDFPQRAQALYCAGLQLGSAKEYDKALATFREVVARFPKNPFAKRARDEVDRLDPPGARGIDFRRRLDEAWDVYAPTRATPTEAQIRGALALFERLLQDHRDHPQASDVALAIGDARGRLGDAEGARAAVEDAVILAKREAEKQGVDPATAGNVVNAQLKLVEAKRVILRRSFDRTAKALLVVALGVFVSVRPWRVAPPRRLLRLAGLLLAVDAVLALVAVGVAEYVHRYVDDHSPLEDVPAALLVLLPGLVGVIVSLGIANAVKGRRGTYLAAATGAVAGAAVAVTIVYANGLFPFLDSEL